MDFKRERREIKLKVVASLLTLTLLLALVLGFSPVTAGSSTFYLDPGEFNGRVVKARAGSIFSLTLRVDNVTNLGVWNATIEWDPTYFDLIAGPLPGGFGRDVFNNGTITAGKIFNMTLMVPFPPDAWGGLSYPPGDNSLAIMTFKAKFDLPAEGKWINITYAAWKLWSYDWETGVGEYIPQPSPETANTKVVPIVGVTEIEWMTPWTSPHEMAFWNNCIAEYEALHPDVTIHMSIVSFSDFWAMIVYRHSIGADPDVYTIWDAWIPDMVENEMLTIPMVVLDWEAWPDPTFQDNIRKNWHSAAVTGCTYLHYVWGYPTELDGEALVYNERILNETVGYDNIPKGRPWTWTELKNIATAATTRDTDGKINRTGFCFLDAPPSWPRFTFTEMLWSNGGEEYTVPPTKDREILFNSTKGIETLNWISSLRNVTYDPTIDYGVWWDGWEYPEKVVMMILPNDFNYIKGAMGANYTDLRIAPIPIGPSGKRSYTHVHSWLNTVSRTTAGAEEAWEFLEWLNKPQPDAAPYGAQPTAHNVSRMGDFLVYDGRYPSRINDIENSQAYISQDFWLKGFGEIATTYGRVDEYFVGYVEYPKIGYDEYSREISVDLLEPILAGTDVTTTVNNVAPVILKKLPIPGDINHDGVVDIFDLVLLAVCFGYCRHRPWDPRIDFNGDCIIDIFDIVLIAINFGRKNDC